MPAVNQIELHPWLPQTEVRAYNAAHGIRTQSWSPLARGRAIGNAVLDAIGAKYGKSAAQVVLRWHVELGNIVIPKSVTPARMRANLDVFDFSLDPADLTAIAALNSGERTGKNPDALDGPPARLVYGPQERLPPGVDVRAQQAVVNVLDVRVECGAEGLRDSGG